MHVLAYCNSRTMANDDSILDILKHSAHVFNHLIVPLHNHKKERGKKSKVKNKLHPLFGADLPKAFGAKTVLNFNWLPSGKSPQLIHQRKIGVN